MQIMTNPPKISIIIPVYNVEKYVEQCLNSIAEQTFENWECILVNDGSIDLSGIICDSYQRKDHRFKVVHQKNMGVSVARNIGIGLSAAPYISFVDPDDYISPDYFELLIKTTILHNADIAFADTVNINEDGEQNLECLFANLANFLYGSKDETVLESNEEIISYVAKGHSSFNSWGKIYKKHFWEEMRFPKDVDLGEELTVIPKIITRAQTAVVVNRARYYYRIRKQSLLHGTVTKDRLRKTMLHSSKAYKELSVLFPEHKKDFAKLKISNDLCCLLNLAKNENEEKTHGSRLYMMQEHDSDFLSAIIEAYFCN